MKIAISIGVNNLYISSVKCPFKKTERKLFFSFALTGDFLKAALNDKLTDTLDYEALCNHLKKSAFLLELECTSFLTIVDHLIKEVSNFSPLLSAGFVSCSLRCHDTFTIEKALDIKNPSQALFYENKFSET
jgi:hypothetical protein